MCGWDSYIMWIVFVAWHGMAHIQPHMHKLCVLRGFHKNLKNQKYEKKSPQRNAMNFEHFMSCSICLWEFKRIYFHRIVHSSLFTNYHKLKYIPPDSRCICAVSVCVRAVVYYQSLNDAYWKSILDRSLLCGKINFEFVCNNVTLCFEHGRKYIVCVYVCVLKWIFVCFEHRKWHDTAATRIRFEYCLRHCTNCV